MSIRRLVALAGALSLVAALGPLWPATSEAATTQVDIQDSQFVARGRPSRSATP